MRAFIWQNLRTSHMLSYSSAGNAQEDGDKSVPLEVLPEVKHDKRGILSMGRHSDPNSGKSSFSILLGPAPHLDMQYTIFGCAVPVLNLAFRMIPPILSTRCSVNARMQCAFHSQRTEWDVHTGKSPRALRLKVPCQNLRLWRPRRMAYL